MTDGRRGQTANSFLFLTNTKSALFLGNLLVGGWRLISAVSRLTWMIYG